MTTATNTPVEEEKTKVGSDSKKFDFANCTQEELFERVELWRQGKDRKNGDEFLLLEDNDPVVYERINQMLLGESNDPPKEEKTTPEDEAPPQETKSEEVGKEDDDFIEIPSIKLRKDQLGTFLKNRSPAEALLLKLDAHDHAERTIVDLKERNNGLSSQTMKLREQLIETKRQAAKPQPEAPQEKLEEFDLNRDDTDLYDPDQQEKFLSNYEKLLQKVREGNKPPSQVAQEQNENDKELSSDEQELAVVLQNQSLQREFDEIDDLQRAVPELRFSDGSTFLQKDQQLANFRAQVANVAGLTDYVKAHQEFLSNPQIRQLCEARGITEPPELDKWREIVTVRAERTKNINDYAQKIGKKPIEIPNFVGNTYLDVYNRTAVKTGFDKEKLAAQVRAHEETVEKKQRQESRYVSEPPPQASHASHSEIGQMNEADIMNIVNRYGSKGVDSISSDEAKLLIRLNEVQGIDQPLDLLQKAKG